MSAFKAIHPLVRFGIPVLSLLSTLSCGSAAFAQRPAAPLAWEAASRDVLSSPFSLYQPYLKNISSHEPVFFLVGTDPAKSKFQVSFAYRFFNEETSLAQSHPWTKGIHFGYTQTSFWDLAATSRPFADTSYKPELFFISSPLLRQTENNARIFAQAGLKHESNGRAGADSRGTNLIYIKPILVLFSTQHSVGLQVAPQMWAYYMNDTANNPDLKNYRGHFDVSCKVGRPDRLVVEALFRPARAGNSYTLDVTYPAHQLFLGNIDVYVHAQYSNVLAENLFHYRERTQTVRLGISIIR